MVSRLPKSCKKRKYNKPQCSKRMRPIFGAKAKHRANPDSKENQCLKTPDNANIATLPRRPSRRPVVHIRYHWSPWYFMFVCSRKFVACIKTRVSYEECVYTVHKIWLSLPLVFNLKPPSAPRQINRLLRLCPHLQRPLPALQV
jgi:hypothetical protein